MEKKLPKAFPFQNQVLHRSSSAWQNWFLYFGLHGKALVLGGYRGGKDPTGAGEKCEEEEEVSEVSEAMCDELTAVSMPQPPTPLWAGGRENQSEIKPGKKLGWRKVFF